MAVAMMVDNPEGSQEVYEQLRTQLGLGQAGGRHLRDIAGPSPNGALARVIEVWGVGGGGEAPFQDRFVPALRSLGSTARLHHVSSCLSTTQRGRRR